ncbi:sulfatase [Jiangella asiatica]|uniref:sulfatase family protein n=1 Tax=Jiangella asiatica TaxID=2530372 RepID=UPI0013A5C1EA|nr:sulfatase [Jiangella asiatica]
MIITDDQRADEMAAMPRTRRLLGRSGTTFENAVVTTPHCAPSRSSLHTGLLAHNHGRMANNDPTSVDFSESLAVWLQRAGYYTSHTGKVLLNEGPAFRLPGFEDWFAQASPNHYNYFDFNINDNGVVKRFEGPENYNTDVIAAHAVDVIHAQRDSDQPLFMSIAPITPHDTPVGTQNELAVTVDPEPAPRHVGAYADAPLPLPPSFNEADNSDKPMSVRNRPRLTEQQVEEVTANYRARLAALLSLDEAVESICDALRETGRLDNTILVFTSDNGWMLGEHRYGGGKGVPYEPSIRVPLLMRGPGIPAGRVRPPVTNVDLTATFVEAAGAAAPYALDGMPLLRPERLRRKNLERVVPLEIDFDGRGGPFDTPNRYYGARTVDWKYVFHTHTGEEELYHLRTDPHELSNLAEVAEHAAVKARLKAEAKALSVARGRSCQRWVKLPSP